MAINAAASVAEAIILRGAGKLVLDAFGAGAKGISITIEPKIADQMGKRGWTESSIQSVIDKPVKTVVTKDTRFDTVSGSRLNDPATGYIAKDGSYVVRNDRTGAIVQVSNKKDPEWVAPWD
nr:colicin E5-related ribonuclease [Pseudomonas amygdali]